MRSLRGGICALLLLAAAGCASVPLRRPALPPERVAAELIAQDTLTARRYLRYRERLMSVSARIRTASPELCGREVGRFLGIFAVPLPPDTPGERMTARFAGFPVMQVIFVLPGSPADRAGVQQGDRVVTAGGRPVWDPRELEVTGSRPTVAPLALRFVRGDSLLTASVTSVPACSHPVTLAWSHVLEGRSGGNGVSVTTGMMRFVESDDELAQVVGHEIAHEILHHRLLPTPQQRFELEADDLGCYLAARAGYGVAGAADFLRRFAAEWVNTEEAPAGMRTFMAQRIVALDAVAREIARKREAGEALTP
ncbi:MAG: hypothetical protein JO040_11020 [Gemmatimonadetes bacterium]|nr:hypothetical protein [Gemmatimonadota bacterium]